MARLQHECSGKASPLGRAKQEIGTLLPDNGTALLFTKRRVGVLSFCLIRIPLLFLGEL
jgi:hypothetical protein